MTTIILAAGYGTRLYPLTLDKPKALLKVGEKSILERLVTKIKETENCAKIIIVTNEKFYSKLEKWAKSQNSTVEIKVINDKTNSNETRLGAIGDINLVLEKEGINDDLLITGSDNLFDEDLGSFVNFAESKKPFSTIALFDVKDKSLASKYGICSLDKDMRVQDFEEKPRNPESTLAASALYYIPKEKVKRIFEYMKSNLPKDAPGNLMKWLSREDRLFGYVLSGTWYDIGDKKSLKEADSEFRKKEERNEKT